MVRLLLLLGLLLTLAGLIAAAPLQPVAYVPVAYQQYDASVPAPTATSTPTPTWTLTPTPTSTPSPTLTLTPTPGQPHVVIGYIQYSSRDEYIRIDNAGSAPQSMAGWRIQSVVGNQWYHFPPDYVLQAKTSVFIHSGPAAKEHPPTDLRWTTSYIWNNSGDKAVLYNGSAPVDEYCYKDGCP